MDKKQIAAILEEMGTLLELQGANPFKARAFHNASRVLGGLTRDLEELIDTGEILDVQGIGKSIAQIITELIRDGASREHAELRRGVPEGLLEILAIPGLGPKRVKVLYDKLKISTLDELEKAAREDRLSALDGFGQKTEENILKGLEALRKRSDKSLFPVAFEAGTAVLEDLRSLKEVVRSEIAGSIRRRKELIGDIDILVSAADKHRARIMQKFIHHPLVESVIAHGETKSTVVLKGGIACDLRIVSDREFPFALNYFTGSKDHNVAMRGRAKKFALSLNEYGFSRAGEEEKRGSAKRVIPCKDEAAIYKALRLSFVPPELREDVGEIEAAEKGAIPHLVEEKDIRGTFHCHTRDSDGVNTLEEMVQAARKLQWEYLGIGDHSKSAAYAGGLTEERVRKQLKDIEALDKKLRGFRLFSGTECDILPDGSLDWPDNVLALFDYVVVSVHSKFRMTEPEMTKRIIRALKNKYVTMLGHPTGRLLLSREPYPVDMVQVIDAAADYGKLIEINAHPMRLDLDWRLCKYAKEKGVLIAINPDAHSVEGLKDVSFGVGIARKGWLEKKDVLNTKSAAEVAAFFNSFSRRFK
jgi:DNA polymerase (family 10)